MSTHQSHSEKDPGSKAIAAQQGDGIGRKPPAQFSRNAPVTHEVVFDRSLIPDRFVPGDGAGAIQRRVIFDEEDESDDPVIVEVWIDRPTGTSNSGPHTTAISLFQQATMNAMLYRTYSEALHNLNELVIGIRALPGYIENREQLEFMIAGMQEMIEKASGANPMNRAVWLDDIAKQYILMREKVPFTHHESGEGGGSAMAEQKALGDLHNLVMDYLNGDRVNVEETDFGMKIKTPKEKDIAEKLVGLLDLRNLAKPDKIPYLQWVFKVGTVVSQFLVSFYQAYPALLGNQLLRDYTVALCADATQINAEILSNAITKILVRGYSARSSRNVLEMISSRFRVGHADGNNNECLLHTIVQLLESAGANPLPSQAELHQFLVDAQIIENGQMIDIYNVNVTQAIAANYNVQFQVHQVTPFGTVIDHPVIGNNGPVLHIMHNMNHFTPLYPGGQQNDEVEDIEIEEKDNN